MKKPFTAITTALLSVICALQLLRFLLGWEVAVNGVRIPLWASAIAFVVAGLLAAMLWKEARD
jgi:hypothetical protein